MPNAMNAILPQISSNSSSVNASSSSTSSSSSKESFASTLKSCTQSQNSTDQGSSSVYNSTTNDPSPAANATPQAQQQSTQTQPNATSDTSQTNQGKTASTAANQSTVNGQSKTGSDKASQQEAATPPVPDNQTPVSVYGMLAAVAVQVAVQKTTVSTTGTVKGVSQQGVDPASATQTVAVNGQQASISPVVTQQTMAPTLLQAVTNQTAGKGQPVSGSASNSDVTSNNNKAAGLANVLPAAGSLTSDTALNGLALSHQTGVSSSIQEVLSTTLQSQTPTNGDKSDVATKVADLFSKGQKEALTNATDLSGRSNITANLPTTGSQALSGSIGQNGSTAADLLQNGQNNASSSAQSAGNSATLSVAQVLGDKLTVTKQTVAQSTGNQTGTQENATVTNHDPLAALTALGAQTNQQTFSDHSQNSFGLKEGETESLLANHKEEGSSASATESMSFSQVLASNNSSTHPEAVSSGTTGEAATPKDSFQVVQQIVDQAKLITGDQSNEMIIKLKPEHLGELTLKVTVEQGLVTATFHSGNSDVRAAIESSLPQLKQELANSGLKVDNVGVYTSLNQFMSNQQQSQQPQQQAKIKYAGKNRSEAAEAFEDVVEPLTEISATGGSDGVDYLI